MTVVLLTGFGPFAGDARNPSGEAVGLVAARWDGPETLITAVLPVEFEGAAVELDRLIAAHDPDVVIATGLAGGRRVIGVERVAVNIVDARIPDNAGSQPIDEPSVAGASEALFSTLPAKAIVRDVSAAGIPCELSMTAGTFVCNHVFFHAALWAGSRGRRAGFVHVPWAAGQAPGSEPELPMADIVTALEIAVRMTLDTAVDAVEVGGSLH